MITKEYLAILESEQLDEGMLKNAALAATLTGSMLMHQNISHDQNLMNPVHSISHQSIQRDNVIPKHQMVTDISTRYKIDRGLASEIVDSAHRHAAPNGMFPQAHHLLALAGVESSMRPFAKSNLKHQKAIGLTQIRPAMHGLKPHDLATVDGQMKHASAILQKMHSRMKTIPDSLCAYNNGISATLRGGANVNHKYAPKVLGELKHYLVS